MNHMKASTVVIMSLITTCCYADFFGSKQSPKKTFKKEFSMKPGGTLSLENVTGKVVVKSRDADIISLIAEIQSPNAEHLAQMNIATDMHGNKLIIRPVYDPKLTGSIDYTLTVPRSTTLNLTTYTGTINVKDVKGAVVAKTTQGSIELAQIQNSVDASTQAGSIVLTHIDGTITANTQKGSITIVDPAKNVNATTAKGDIDLYCNRVPAAKIALQAKSGNIEYHIPKSAHVMIQAQTNKGTVLSDHALTLQPRVTQLNKNAWKESQQDVKAILGSGSNPGHIKMYAHNSIKISDISALNQEKGATKQATA